LERRRRTGDLLERVGLKDVQGIPLRKYSKGMTQRLGIAQALLNNPEVVFLDEPMSGLDPVGRREVRDLILEWKRAGKTVFFSTHILSDAETLCDQVAILNRGRLQGCGELRKILGMSVAATEMVLEDPPPDVLRELESIGCSAVRTGDVVRVEIPHDIEVAPVLKVALQRGAKISSLNPLKMSLEDYFMSQVAPDTKAEVNGPASISAE
jgi:ABC-2 type transport system ATP-binding protein